MAALLLAAAGCGSEEPADGGTRAGGDASFVAERAHLPRPSNRSLRGLIAKMRQGPELAPSVSLLEPGRNRFGFGLFDRSRRQIGGLEVGLYVARGLDDTARGPFVARYEPIEVKPPFRSQTSSQDPDSARSVYVAQVLFGGPGSFLVTAIMRLGGQLVATSPTQVIVTARSRTPAVGERAIAIHTPTRSSAPEGIEKIETRVPPDSMHEADFADTLAAKRPAVLLFSSPALCQSRVCGPVTDVTEQVKSDFADRMDFIHMEIYRDNEFEKGVRQQVRAYALKSEPFVFVVDDSGTIVARIEGAFSASELEAAVRKALR